MSRSTVPKVRIPTVDELESSTSAGNFTKFRQPTIAASSDQNISSSASTTTTTVAATNDSNFARPRSPGDEIDQRRRENESQQSTNSIGAQSSNNVDSSASSASSSSNYSSRAFGGSAVLVNPRQRGNPLLRFLRNVPYEFGDSPADYLVGDSCCALFLSLKFHKLHSDYVHERLKDVGHRYATQILLVQVDIAEPEQSLRELNTISFNANWTMLLAWNPEEAAELLESYKIYENKPPDFLMARQETDPRARLIDLLTSIKSITRTDAENLIVTFGSLKSMIEASEEQLNMCPGLGAKKAKRLFHAFGASWRIGGVEEESKNRDDLVAFSITMFDDEDDEDRGRGVGGTSTKRRAAAAASASNDDGDVESGDDLFEETGDKD